MVSDNPGQPRDLRHLPASAAWGMIAVLLMQTAPYGLWGAGAARFLGPHRAYDQTTDDLEHQKRT
jgi:hypothetical protein